MAVGLHGMLRPRPGPEFGTALRLGRGHWLVHAGALAWIGMKPWQSAASLVYWAEAREPRERAMQLVDLILLACALANPGSCREHHVLLQSSGSLRGCMMQAQPYLAQWIGEHPGLRIANFRCAWPDQEEEKG